MYQNINSTVKNEHPTIVELRARIKQCRAELLNLLNEWHYMQTIVHSRIMFEYENIFGDIEYEIEKKSETAADLERKLLELSNKSPYNRMHPQSSSYTSAIHKQNDKFAFNSKKSPNNNKPFNYCNIKYRNPEIPNLYRALVKKLHPDVCGETETFKMYWDNIQDAYKTGNIRRLRLFHKTLVPNDKEYNSSLAEEISLRSEIRDLEYNIEIEKQNIMKLRQEEPFVYEDKLNDYFWVAKRKRKLLEQLYQINQEISNHKKMLRALNENNPKIQTYVS